LARSPPQRTGATAEALRRNQTSEAYVREVISNPDNVLQRFNVAVSDRQLTQFPNEHQYFTAANYEEFYSRIKWQLEEAPRTHDATVLAHVMRMRGDNNASDIFGNRHILITRNGTLAQMARRFCIDANLITTRTCPPIIHQRQLATAIWLRTGFNNEETQEIPRRYLLAACERVLELKKSIVDQVRLTARSLTPEKAEQLDLLLTQDRSAQILMDKTLGLSNVITTTNIGALVDTMKQGLVLEIKQEKEAEVAEIAADASSKIRKAHAGRRSAEDEAARLQSALRESEEEDKRAIAALIRDTNKDLRKRKSNINWAVSGALMIIASLPMLSEALSGVYKFGSLFVAGIIAAVFGHYQFWDKKIGLQQGYESWGLKRIHDLAISRGLERKLAVVSLVYVDGELTEPRPVIEAVHEEKSLLTLVSDDRKSAG